MPLQATSGAASYDAFGGGVAAVPNYIEEVFSTYLYTGASASQTITNGIDLSTYGGLVVIKGRSTPTGSSAYGGAANQFTWQDTVRGITQTICSNRTDAQLSAGGFASNSSISTSGFTLDYNGYNDYNRSPNTYASWTFRKQPKFFDVVTYTGTGSVQNISHNLGSVPGCIIVKSTTATEWWAVQHRSLGATKSLYLNSTNAEETNATNWNNTSPTSTQFTVGTNTPTNLNGATYVAYLFAHDAGGFGLTGTDNVISCGSGSWSGGSDNVVNLGYEVQWLMYKSTDIAGSNWMMFDTMRGMSYSASEFLRANLADAAGTYNSPYAIYPTATGFTVPAGMVSTGNYIYIAIRRGPMKVPTSGTSVFTSVARTGDRLAGSLTGIGFNPDSLISLVKTGGYQHEWNNKLAGPNQYLRTTTNESEFTSTDLKSYDQDGISFNATDFNSIVNRISPLIQYFLKRAPSVFDIVCYSGNSTARTINHNLGVAPELMIVKSRNLSGADWQTYASPIGNTSRLLLNTTDALADGQPTWNSTTPTSSVFSLGTSSNINGTSYTYVAYLFATCAGVSKVGSYTGTGALQTINCGFTSGARFILIKRTDSTGSWWLYDSTRGISSSDDPYLFLNSNGAEVTNTNYVDTDTTGFKVTAAAPADLNASGGTYIFLAIA